MRTYSSLSGRCRRTASTSSPAHDGFTLYDLVSYNTKHNEANGEGNRDGNNDNESWNCGVEGETGDAGIEALRGRQIKNFAAILLLAQGVPMIVAGDEVRRTQRGNNNAYCQDNEISWFDWDAREPEPGYLPVLQGDDCVPRAGTRSSAVRISSPARRTSAAYAMLPGTGASSTSLAGPTPVPRVLAFTMGGFDGEADLHVMLNMYGADLEFDVPPVPGRSWRRAVDTSLPSPEDIAVAGDEIEVKPDDHYRVDAHSIVVLISQ